MIDLPERKYGAILADPPWPYWTYGQKLGIPGRTKNQSYPVMQWHEIEQMPIRDISAKDSVLFCWVTWPKLKECLSVINEWGFEYKSCAFDWMKADNRQLHFFDAEKNATMGMGYWTRANTEPCLLATKGSPSRLDAGVRQGIISPRREHSRKPDCVYERIERLVAGPYLELFARNTRPGWDSWGNEVDKFAEVS